MFQLTKSFVFKLIFKIDKFTINACGVLSDSSEPKIHLYTGPTLQSH